MSYTKTVNLENFQKLVEGLSTLSIYLDDIDMIAGKVRQPTADKVTLLNMDFSNIFNEDLCISGIKSKLPLFELIADDGDNVITIQSDDKFWFLSNSKTTFKFSLAVSNRLTTSYLPDDKFESFFEKNSTDDKLIYSINIEDRPDIHKKIKKVTDTYNSDKLTLNIDKEDIRMVIESIDKKNDASIIKEKNENRVGNNYEIVLRSNFVDKLDSKVISKIIFYDDFGSKSITKAFCKINDFNLDIYTFCKCSKS